MSLDAPLPGEIDEQLAGWSSLAFRVAYAVLRSRVDAEDVAQEAVVRVVEKRGALRDRERFRAWLVRIAWRLALDRRRSDKRRELRERGLASVPAVTPPTAEQLAISRQLEERVWQAIDTLPEKLRVVVVLGSIEGHEVLEVAALLGLPEGTVKSRLHLARRRLAEKLRWIVSGTQGA